MRCEHYACKCLRAVELAEMADRTLNWGLLYEAANLGEVECRQQQGQATECER